MHYLCKMSHSRRGASLLPVTPSPLMRERRTGLRADVILKYIQCGMVTYPESNQLLSCLEEAPPASLDFIALITGAD